MKKIRLYAVLLICFCVFLFGGCGGKSENGKSDGENESSEAYSTEMWCYNKAVEGINEKAFIDSIISYSIQEMAMSEDSLKYVHDGETAKCYYINFVYVPSLNNALDNSNIIESYCIIIYRGNKTEKIYEEDIAFFTGKFNFNSSSGGIFDTFGTRTYTCPVCSESQELVWGERREYYVEYEDRYYPYYVDYYSESCSKCYWLYEQKLLTETEEEYVELLRKAKENYAQGLTVGGSPIET